MKCLIDGVLFLEDQLGSPKGYHALNTSQPTFLLPLPANLRLTSINLMQV